MLVSPSAASTLQSAGCLQSTFPQRRSGVRARTAGADEHSSRDIHQIKRLRYLLDAREAKVQAVLDEAMSWLIVPFGADGDNRGVKEEIPRSLRSPAAESRVVATGQVPVPPPPVSGGGVRPCPKAGRGATAHGKAEENAAVSAAAAQTCNPALLSSQSPTPESDDLDQGTLSEVETTADLPSEGGVHTDGPSDALGASAHSAGVATCGTTKEASPDTRLGPGAPEPQIVGGMPEPKHVHEMPEPVSFTTEELQKLDAEAAWDELEAEEEKDGWDCPLLPKLVAASPIAFGLKKAGGTAQAGAAATDSPKRKRGRPKGSGKKNKSRLENSSSATPAAVAAPAVVVLPEVLNQLSPAIPLYDSQSPGCSAATNSPPSLWSGSSCDTFPPLADLLDISADPMGLLGSGLSCTLASPPTPSSRGSSMLRSISSASFNSATPTAAQEEPGGMKVTSPRGRSARIHAGVQARRLFGVEEEPLDDFEEPLFVPKESKKNSKSKTGRPRGRPRKIRPNERPSTEGEDQ